MTTITCSKLVIETLELKLPEMKICSMHESRRQKTNGNGNNCICQRILTISLPLPPYGVHSFECPMISLYFFKKGF